MTWELQSTCQVSGIEWIATRNHIPCTVQVIQLALGAFISTVGLQGCTKAWEANEGDQLFGENQSTGIGKSQRLRKDGNARFNQMSVMRPCVAKVIETVRISRHVERPETYLHIAENACCIDNTDTWLSKRVHSLSKRHSTNRSTTQYGCENTEIFYTGVAWASLQITRIHLGVAPESNIMWLPATLQNTGWMDHRQVRHGTFKAIPILNPVDVKQAYGYSASHHHCLTRHGWSYGLHYASCS